MVKRWRRCRGLAVDVLETFSLFRQIYIYMYSKLVRAVAVGEEIYSAFQQVYRFYVVYTNAVFARIIERRKITR